MIVIFTILIILYTSWIFLYLIPKKRSMIKLYPLSIIIPAYNEQENIESTIRSVISADYPKKEIIVVDDGSLDKTYEIVKNLAKKKNTKEIELKIVKGQHKGKAIAVNLGMKHAKYDFIAVLDADTEIDRNALKSIMQPFSDGNVAAVASVLRVKKEMSILNWFQQFEYATSSAWRYVIDKINGLCIVPGFCAFRKSMLMDVGGFTGNTCVEDYDICMYLRKKKYNIAMSDAIAYTRAPSTFSGLIKQRVRWSRGTVQVIKKHRDMLLNKDHISVGFYSMPTQIYWFIHAVSYIPLTIYQIISGYFTYFVSYGNILSIEVLLYFTKWFTFYGMIDFMYNILIGLYPMNLLNTLVIIIFTLSYGFSIMAIYKFSKFDIQTLTALFFFFPYVLAIVSVNMISLIHEIIAKDKGEKWDKS